MGLIGIEMPRRRWWSGSAAELYEHVRVVIVARRTYPVPRPHEAYNRIMRLLQSNDYGFWMAWFRMSRDESSRLQRVAAMKKIEEGGHLYLEEYERIRELGEFLKQLIDDKDPPWPSARQTVSSQRIPWSSPFALSDG